MKAKNNTSLLMKEFWNQKARENPMYYISAFRPYSQQDPEDFWKWGEILSDRYLKQSGISFSGEESVLDVGCGIGRLTRPLAERFSQVVGLDVSEEMINQGRENLEDYKNIRLEVGNGKDLSNFKDQMFDFVFSYLTFQHIPEVAITLQYIREVGRVLRPGGHFYFQVNNSRVAALRSRLRLRSRCRSLIARLEASLGSPPAEGNMTSHANGPRDLENPAWRGSYVSIKQIRNACRDGGLHILDVKGQGTRYLWVTARKCKRNSRY